MKTFYIRFIKELLKRHYRPKDIRSLYTDVTPFFIHIVSVKNIYTIKEIKPEHVTEYCDSVRASITGLNSFWPVLHANNKLCAVRMFCLQMFIAGVLPSDYSIHAGFIDIPDTVTANHKNDLLRKINDLT